MPDIDGADGQQSGPPPSTPAETDEEVASAATELLDEIDPEKARVYDEAGTYEVGEIVHHRAWNDYGIVKATETLPGNRHIIRVRFVNAGEVQLLVGTDH